MQSNHHFFYLASIMTPIYSYLFHYASSDMSSLNSTTLALLLAMIGLPESRPFKKHEKEKIRTQKTLCFPS